jgi:hypothetical protein
MKIGFTTPHLEEPQQPITYSEGSYMIDFKNRLRKIGETKLWIERIWPLKLQRVNNDLSWKNSASQRNTKMGTEAS